MSSPNLICPSCAAPLHRRVQYSKLIICSHCGAQVFLEDEGARLAGQSSVLSDEPSIFSMHKSIRHKGKRYLPVGRLRYDYGRGWWDEWWMMTSDGEATWFSVDEGHIAIEKPFEMKEEPPSFDALSGGDEFKIGEERLIVQEKNHCTLIGGEGELPFRPEIGEEHDYADLLGEKGRIYTLEYYEDGIEMYRGRWVDPYSIRSQK